MKSIINIDEYKIAPEGHTVVILKAGDTVDGSLAEKCVKLGIADSVDKPKAIKPKSTKPNKRGPKVNK